jgi:hypothetical protein
MAAPSSWKAWRSVSVAWARMGTEVPAKLEELLAGIGAAIDAVGGSFTMRYTTVAVTAARTGAASPAFTLSAPGGDAETVRRHGDFVSAEPEDSIERSPQRVTHRGEFDKFGVDLGQLHPRAGLQPCISPLAGAYVADLQQVRDLVQRETQPLCCLDHPQHRDCGGRIHAVGCDDLIACADSPCCPLPFVVSIPVGGLDA